MADFETTCQHCGKPLTAQRSTRKYHEACRSAAARDRRKQERIPDPCWICGREIVARDVQPRAVLTREQILRVQCRQCGAEPGWECDRYNDMARLGSKEYQQWEMKRPSHARRVDDARDALFAMESANREAYPRRYCDRPECRREARRRARRARAYRERLPVHRRALP